MLKLRIGKSCAGVILEGIGGAVHGLLGVSARRDVHM